MRERIRRERLTPLPTRRSDCACRTVERDASLHSCAEPRSYSMLTRLYLHRSLLSLRLSLDLPLSSSFSSSSPPLLSVAIASDMRFGIQQQTLADNFKKIYRIHDKLFIGLTG